MHFKGHGGEWGLNLHTAEDSRSSHRPDVPVGLLARKHGCPESQGLVWAVVAFPGMQLLSDPGAVIAIHATLSFVNEQYGCVLLAME